MSYFNNLSKLEISAVSYLSLYLHILENDSSLKEIIRNINFHSDEANTDKELKLVIKEYLSSNSAIQELNLQDNFKIEFKIDEHSFITYYSEIKDFYIKNVLLPEELDDKHKEWLRNRKTGVYVNPDLLIEISNGTFIQYITLELKSTKNDKIPGSSVQQVDPYEMTLFIKHNSQGIFIASGLYANSITSRLPFPDRSPRPEISFSNLTYWNTYNRIKNNDCLTFILTTKELLPKLLIISDWKRALVNDWIDYVNSDKVSSKWFDDTLRMFASELIQMYENMDSIERIEFMKKNQI